MIVTNLMVLIAVGILAVPVVILAVEVIASLFGAATPKPGGREPGPDFHLAVIVPAHNESASLALTLAEITAQLGPRDRLLAVADNCSDDTASVARACGAEVAERHDPDRRGKGYALDFGLRHLARAPPHAVVFIDADCRLGPDTIQTLGRAAFSLDRAIQSFNEMVIPGASSTRERVTAFAWLLKTDIRPRGLAALGLPCQMMGTGMAMTWDRLQSINLASGNIVEDVRLGLDLAEKGAAPLYCPQARVSSELPGSSTGLEIQRRRWESGSLRILMKDAPAMLAKAIASGNLNLGAMATDLLVPPLVLLLVLSGFGFAVTFVWWLATGLQSPVMISTAALVLLAVTLIAAWARFGRHILQIRDMVFLPLLILNKVPHYIGLWTKRNEGWIRTDRK